MQNHQHFMIHKPYGFLSQFIYKLKRKKKLLGELYNFPQGIMAIGRLDEDSEGLLLLTTSLTSCGGASSSDTTNSNPVKIAA